MHKFARMVLCCLGFVSLAKAEAEGAADKDVAREIRPALVVLPADWVTKLPPSERVNAPEFLTALYPGQRVALGVVAGGPDRERLLKGLNLAVKFSTGSGGEKEMREVKPGDLRQIKAEGADFVLMALKGAGISEQELAKTRQATSLVTLAVVLPDWAAPEGEVATEVEIAATVSGISPPLEIAPIRLKVRPTREWLSEGTQTEKEAGEQMNRHRAALPPGRLLGLLSSVATTRSFNAPPVQAFFAFAFKANSAAREAAVQVYPTLDPAVRPALLRVLRLGGHDLKQLLPDLPADEIARHATLAPLADPRTLPRFQDPVDPAEVSRAGHVMDVCWMGWTATGDVSYLRALVDLLEGAPDYPAYTHWRESRGGAKGLNAAVGRGLLYQIAGWSIGSFQRTDPLVADWLLFWEQDPAMSPTVRREIGALATNPAFRRK